MSSFAEPSVTLCGKKHPAKYAICAKKVKDRTDHTGPCVWVAAIDVYQRLQSTFTPCRWLHAVE